MERVSHERIVAEATRLFSQKGYHGTSMGDIAQAVGIPKGHLYYYIRSKEQLLYEIAGGLIPKLLGNATQFIEDKDMSAEQKLRIFIAKHLEFFGTEAGLASARVFLLEYRALSKRLQKNLLEKREQYESYIRRLVAEGVERGEFSQVDVAMAGRAILSLCNWTIEWYHPKNKLSTEEIASIYSDMILKGLLKP